MTRSVILLYSIIDARWDDRDDSTPSVYPSNSRQEEDDQKIKGSSDLVNHPRVRHNDRKPKA